MILLSCQPTEENHLHTLAFDATEPGALYLGTHYFLEKYQDESIIKIGPYGEDYMGFVISKDGTFYSSGHSSRISNVGIRKSSDKGKSWETLAYEGLDFHDMAVSYANAKVIYAWSTPPEELLVASKDGGKTWNEINADFQSDLYSLAADHQQENILYAGTLLGLFVSQDYGQTWNQRLQNLTILAIADDPLNEETMYLSTFTRGVLRTIEGGVGEEMNLGLPDSEQNPLLFLAVNPHNSTQLWGFTRDNEIFMFDGKQWNKIHAGDTE